MDHNNLTLNDYLGFFSTFIKDIKYIFCTVLYKYLLYSYNVNLMRNIHLWYITIHYFIRSVQQEVVYFVQYQISYFFRIVVSYYLHCTARCHFFPYCTVSYFLRIAQPYCTVAIKETTHAFFCRLLTLTKQNLFIGWCSQS